MAIKSFGNALATFKYRFGQTGNRASNEFSSSFVATGGSAGSGSGITPGDGYRYFVFTSTGSNPFVVSSGIADAEYIAVGGGGGGSDRGNGAGGGGAGGLLTNWPGPTWTGGTSRNRGPSMPLAPGTYTITIGGGGAGGDETPGPPARGVPGGNTTISGPTFSTITCYGGGAGANDNFSSRYSEPGANGLNPGQPNGSGDYGGSGGGANGPGTGGPAYDYPGPAQQGYPGGSVPVSFYGAGGGGSSSAGTNGGPGIPAPGGNGDGFAGIPPSYGTPGPNAPYRYFAGGGGGGSPESGAGGYGGGGTGARHPNGGVISTAGATNTGGGGGGGADGSPTSDYNGKPGGSGIVIIRYLI